MLRFLISLCAVLSMSVSMAQLGSQANKLVGTWSFKHSNGFEVWSMTNNGLEGNAYRVNKMGDTSRVEKISIKKVQKKLAYTTTTYNLVGDSLHAEKHFFLGGRRKLSFENVENQIPFSIKYKFGFLNKRKLKIFVQYNSGEKVKPIILFKN